MPPDLRPERRPAPKGWCPGAHRPMLSGDGWIVRVRPRLARLNAAQFHGLAQASLRHGSGVIDLTSRANLQLRGVPEAAIEPLLLELATLNLLDVDAEAEARRNVMVTPDWQPGDVTARLAQGLLDRLGDLPPLPAKFGFAVDAGPQRMLAQASADIRIERGEAGLIVRADGAASGLAVREDQAVAAVLAMAEWFVAMGAPGRMARLVATGAAMPGWDVVPVPEQVPVLPCAHPMGAMIGFAFGQIDAAVALALPKVAVRVTPWRMLLLEGVGMPDLPGVLAATDPLLQVDACPGAPFCGAATVETRGLARELARPGLHVSGCSKGCARAKAAAVTLVGRDGRFDVVRQGTAWDMPVLRGLAPGDVRGALHDLDL
jgi:precorrin-3B synthase